MNAKALTSQGWTIVRQWNPGTRKAGYRVCSPEGVVSVLPSLIEVEKYTKIPLGLNRRGESFKDIRGRLVHTATLTRSNGYRSAYLLTYTTPHNTTESYRSYSWRVMREYLKTHNLLSP
jgi:hypothetical protein